jgi:rubredoxin
MSATGAAPNPGPAADERIDGTTRMECKICWQVYDPCVGDPAGNAPAGTSFAQLPGHWRCPQCDSAQDQFLVVADCGWGGIRELL